MIARWSLGHNTPRIMSDEADDEVQLLDPHGHERITLLKPNKSPSNNGTPIPMPSARSSGSDRSSQRDITRKSRGNPPQFRPTNNLYGNHPRRPNIIDDSETNEQSYFKKGENRVKKQFTKNSASGSKITKNSPKDMKNQNDEIAIIDDDDDDDDFTSILEQQISHRTAPKRKNKNSGKLNFITDFNHYRERLSSSGDDNDNNEDQQPKTFGGNGPSGKTASRAVKEESTRIIKFNRFSDSVPSSKLSSPSRTVMVMEPLDFSKPSLPKPSTLQPSLKRKNVSEDDDRNPSRSPNRGGNTSTYRLNLKSLRVGKTVVNVDSEKKMEAIFENKHMSVTKGDDVIFDLARDMCKTIWFNYDSEPKAMLITPKEGWRSANSELDFDSKSSQKARHSILLLVDDEEFSVMLSKRSSFWLFKKSADMGMWVKIMENYTNHSVSENANHSTSENLDNMETSDHSSISDHTMKTRNTTAQISSQNVPLFVYPFNGADAVTIMKDDVERLKDGEFLNDNIIEFYLKWIIDQLRADKPMLADTVHLFNSFFYKRYTGGSKKSRYDSVKKWTAKINLFEKKYIFVPVNEHMHWYLVLISNPQLLINKPKTHSMSKIISSGRRSTRNSQRFQFHLVSGSDDDNAIIVQDDDELSQPSQSPPVELMDVDGQPKKNVAKKDFPGNGNETKSMEDKVINLDSQPSQIVIELDPSQPNALERYPSSSIEVLESMPSNYVDPNAETRIVVFDSLGGKHPRTFSNIRQYLYSEALEKQKMKIDQEDIKPYHAKVPNQTNHCDCGIYILHYVEKFLTNPDKYLELVINKKGDEQAWSPSEIHQKRQQIKELIENTTKEYNKINQNA